MHSVTVRKEIVDRVLQRRGRYHLFDRLDPARTALVVIDMQHTFCAPAPSVHQVGVKVPLPRKFLMPAFKLSATMRSFSAVVQRRRRSGPGRTVTAVMCAL
jgi:hypothetical protein